MNPTDNLAIVPELSPAAKPITADPEMMREASRNQFTSLLRSGKYKPKEIDRNFAFKRPLAHGWMLPYLLRLDQMFWGRWDYWCTIAAAGRLTPDPIPQLDWESVGSSEARSATKFLEAALSAITPGCHWNSWGTWRNFEYLLDWMLYGFGHSGHKTPPEEPSDAKGASARLYQVLDLGPLLLSPADYFGDLLAENAHGRHLGFYPTPMHVCDLMAKMIMGTEDCREQTVCDPCLGTGRMLLAASNYSLCLFGMDINPIVIKASLVNGYLYAPWLVRPFAFLNTKTAEYCAPELAPKVSNSMAEVAAADPRASTYTDWFQTEHDQAVQPQVHPIKVRRPKQPNSAPATVQHELALV